MTRPAAACATMTDLLDLEVIDRDLYRGLNETGTDLPRLFGGQVAAQALRAATLTVPADRRPHSMHGYFLRPGLCDWPVILRVERDRDGRSFSSRHVEALQQGEVIFTMSASFHVHEESGELTQPAPELPGAPGEAPAGAPGWLGDPVEVRQFAEPGAHMSARLWARVKAPLGEDPTLHACALAYISDIGTGFAGTDVDNLPPGGPSLDHAVWFHRPVRADGWVLVDLWPLKGGFARGLYGGSMHGADGTLAAVLAQECLLRPEPPG